nr:vegetative cell wall protein gp1-like [Aegilops tauschii subsp. strangulata]
MYPTPSTHTGAAATDPVRRSRPPYGPAPLPCTAPTSTTPLPPLPRRPPPHHRHSPASPSPIRAAAADPVSRSRPPQRPAPLPCGAPTSTAPRLPFHVGQPRCGRPAAPPPPLRCRPRTVPPRPSGLPLQRPASHPPAAPRLLRRSLQVLTRWWARVQSAPSLLQAERSQPGTPNGICADELHGTEVACAASCLADLISEIRLSDEPAPDAGAASTESYLVDLLGKLDIANEPASDLDCGSTVTEVLVIGHDGGSGGAAEHPL